MDLLALTASWSGFKRAARLAIQLPRDSRYIMKLDPSISWGWPDLFQMMMTQSLRQLVWSKTKDAQKKSPKNAPEMLGPQYILDAMKKAAKMADRAGRLGSHKYTPNARVFNTSADLDAYLKKPRKAVAE